MSVANTVDPEGRTSTARHRCCKSHPWNGHEMGFLKGQGWIHKREQKALQSEHVLKHFCGHRVRKGNNQNFSNVDPTMTEVFFFFEKSRSDSPKRANDVPTRRRAQHFCEHRVREGRGQDFSTLNPKVTKGFSFFFL